MDGENNGKPYEQMDDLGGKPTIFGNIHLIKSKATLRIRNAAPLDNVRFFRWENKSIMLPIASPQNSPGFLEQNINPVPFEKLGPAKWLG